MSWSKRLIWNRVAKIAILTCLIVSVVFAGFTVYGAEVGQFVISAEDGDIALTIHEEDPLDEEYMTTYLTVETLGGQTDATFSNIPSDISTGIGSKNDTTYSRYLAYSFYLVNTDTDDAIDYELTVIINECYNNADTIIRYMILEGDETTADGDIYAAEESGYVYADMTSGSLYTEDQITLVERNGEYKYYYEDTELSYISTREYTQQMAGYTQIDFYDSRTVAYETDQLAASAYTKYTIVLWLEGWDVDCTNDKIGGAIRMEMNFSQIV